MKNRVSLLLEEREDRLRSIYSWNHRFRDGLREPIQKRWSGRTRELRTETDRCADRQGSF